MINENIITLVNEQFNDALRMTKEMNHVSKSADNAMFNMNALRREFEDARNIVKELTVKHAQYNLKLAETKTLLKNVLEGSVEDRIHALATKHNSVAYASTYVGIEKEQAELKEEINKYETAVISKATLIGGCHYAIRDLYIKFQNSLAEAEREKEAMAKKQAEAKPKTITIMVDTSWPMSPREIQKAIDVLKNFKPVGEDGLGLKSATEALESFKKSLENTVAEHTPVIKKGTFFKLDDVEM